MSNIKKFGIIALSLVTVVGLSGAPTPAAAQSVSDLQAQISALLAQIQQLQAQIASTGGTTGGTGVAVSCNFTRNLYPEMSGSDVKCLQQYLNAAGYTVAASGVGSAGNETEYFGTLTKNAVTKWQDANGIQYGSWAGYFGPSSRSKYSALAASGGAGTGTTGGTGTTVPGVTIPSNALNITVAAGNPLAKSIPQGAYGVEYLKFNVAGNGLLRSLTFKRVGLGGANDFANVYLYEGDNRLTSARTVNSTTNEVFFSGLNLDVRNQVKTLSLVVDVDSTGSAAAGEEDAFNITAADSDVTVNGLTVYGNTMKIAGTSVGSISINSTSTPSNPSVGQKQAKMADFQLAAGTTEDIMISRIALTEGGNEQNTNLKNFTLKVGGETVATATSIEDELLTFVFNTPYVLEKGEVETFRVYGDITGDARGSNTIVFYFETNSDIKATGATYGYPVTTTITGMNTTSAGATLTLQAGQVTIAFNGPVAGDISKNGSDVTLFDFSMTAQNNIEVRNTRFSISVTGGGTTGLTDVKMWDADAGRVITSASTVTSSSASVVFTDNYELASGETRNFKITGDTGTTFSDGNQITVTLSAFQSNDVKNLDNNTYVSTSNIVGDAVAGNAQTVRIPALDVQVAGTPASQTYVQGTKDVDFVGFTFRAVADDITLTELKVYASSTSGTITNSDLLNLRLIDADTGEQLGNTESLTSSLTATFDSFEHTISNGDTKKLLVRANISSNITNGDRPFIYVNALGDVTARDSDGNSLTTSGSGLTGSTANSGQTTRVTIASVGSIAVLKAPDDTDSEAGIIVMNGERTLAKFRFTATNENMTINKLDLLLNGANNSTATTTATNVLDEISTLKLYEGTTLLKTVSVQGSGASTGVAFVRNLGWSISKDSSKTMTVKGIVNSAQSGADTGQEVAVHVLGNNFEAQGSTSKDTTLTGASGNEKFVYKTKPTITVAAGGDTMHTGEVEVMRFTVAADSNEQLAWRKIQLKVSPTDATMSAADGVPSTTGNVKIRDISAGSNLDITSAYSGSTATASTSATITGGATGYVTFILANEQTISAGSSKQYGVYLTFADADAGGNGGDSVSVSLNLNESTVSAGSSVSTIEGVQNGTPSFIWSDYSATNHTTSTTDWANGYYVKELPSNTITTQ